MKPHPLLKAGAGGVRLGPAATEGAKAISILPPPPIADAVPGGMTPLPLAPGVGDEGAVITLDLKKGAPADSVNAKTPIRLTADASLTPEDALLLVGFDADSGLYLPLGVGAATKQGVKVAITRVPAGQATVGGKSIGGALSMLAYKLAGDKVGLDNPYPLLRSARAKPSADKRGAFDVTYDEDGVAALHARVAAAQRIAVLVHGFIGDSRSMMIGLPALKRHAPGLADFDLALTFDYENIHTRIQDSALALKERLEDVGLAAGHGKTVHLIGHSLGTQVGRWFIEREGGAKMVQKAVLLGPPNDGTPLAVMQEWLTFLIGLGLNGLLSAVAPWTILTWAVRALSASVAGFEKVDTTLDQLKPKSDFYKDLNRSDDPGIPYHVIIGDTFQIKPKPADPNDAVGALFSQVFSARTRDRLMSVCFANQPNDIAIGLSSAERVLTLKPTRSPMPVVTTVACDHVSYFTDPAGLAALAAALAA